MQLPPDPTNRELALAVSALQDILKEKDEQLRLQAKEYERRLTDLNHAHALSQERDTKFIGMDAYQADNRTISTRLSILELGAANLQGRLWAVGAVSSAIAGLISLVVKFWK